MTKKRTELTADQLRGQVRSAVFERSDDQDSSVIRFPVASDTPIQRWYGQEILSHKPGAMVMGERQKTLPLLFNHNRDKLLGVVEKLDQDKHRTYATVRFSSSEEGQKAKAMVDERVLVNCSFQYEILDYDMVRGEDPDDDQLIATSWEIYEVSLVTIPADSNVGVYRDFETNLKENKMAIRGQENSENKVNDSEQQERENVREAAIAEARRVEVEREKVRQDERQRIENIYSLCRQFNIEDSERENMIRSNESIENIRSHVLDLLGKRSVSPVGVASRGISEDIGLTAAERSNFNLVRALNAALTGDWSKAGFEREVSQTLAKPDFSCLAMSQCSVTRQDILSVSPLRAATLLLQTFEADLSLIFSEPRQWLPVWARPLFPVWSETSKFLDKPELRLHIGWLKTQPQQKVMLRLTRFL